MTAAFGEVIFGLLVLVIGGEVLLRGAVSLATILRLTPAVIGLTVVAAGTSVPELAVSAIAAWQGKADISVGNVVGSNIFNIGFILGVVAMYRRLTIGGNTIRLEYPVLLLVTLCFLLLAQDGWIGRLEALFFLSSYVCFTAYLVRLVRRELTNEEQAEFSSKVEDLQTTSAKLPNAWFAGGLTLLGICLLGWGAEMTVSGAVVLGTLAGLSERIIGLTIIGGGTSLPELVTSLVSSYRGRNDIAIANIIGSNVFNILCILGFSAIISPLQVAPGILSSDNWWMLGFTLLLFPIMRIGFDITKREGMVLLGAYLIYLIQLVIRS